MLWCFGSPYNSNYKFSPSFISLAVSRLVYLWICIMLADCGVFKYSSHGNCTVSRISKILRCKHTLEAISHQVKISVWYVILPQLVVVFSTLATKVKLLSMIRFGECACVYDVFYWLDKVKIYRVEYVHKHWSNISRRFDSMEMMEMKQKALVECMGFLLRCSNHGEKTLKAIIFSTFLLAKFEHFSVMPNASSFIVFNHFQNIFSAHFSKAPNIWFDSGLFLLSHQFHGKRQYCVLCFGSEQHKYTYSHSSVHHFIYVSTLVYAPTFVLVNSLTE